MYAYIYMACLMFRNYKKMTYLCVVSQASLRPPPPGQSRGRPPPAATLQATPKSLVYLCGCNVCGC